MPVGKAVGVFMVGNEDVGKEVGALIFTGSPTTDCTDFAEDTAAIASGEASEEMLFCTAVSIRMFAKSPFPNASDMELLKASSASVTSSAVVC